jgi:hypothetical protein
MSAGGSVPPKVGIAVPVRPVAMLVAAARRYASTPGSRGRCSTVFRSYGGARSANELGPWPSAAGPWHAGQPLVCHSAAPRSGSGGGGSPSSIGGEAASAAATAAGANARTTPITSSCCSGVSAANAGIAVPGAPSAIVARTSSSLAGCPTETERHFISPRVNARGPGHRYGAAGPRPSPRTPWQGRQSRSYSGQPRCACGNAGGAPHATAASARVRSATHRAS